MISKKNWNIYCTRFLVRARQLTEPVTFTDTFGHQHVGQPGDYLVENSNGTRRIATRTFFEDVYLPLTAAAPGLSDHDLPDPGSSARATGSLVRPSSDHQSRAIA
jgi:hypothetical protein